jgi:hypothetical protein
MPRIDPAFPPLWRSATVLQFGERASVTLDDVTDWQLRLIRALERGVSDDSVDTLGAIAGAPAEAVGAFLARLAPVLTTNCGPSPRPRLGVRVAAEVSQVQRDFLVAALREGGHEVSVETTGSHRSFADEIDVVVIIAAHLVEPRLVADLMGGDRPHMPLVLSGTGAHVGPLIVPGATACLACIAQHHTDADAAWPTLAAQLCARTVEMSDPALLREAAITAQRLLSAPRPTSDAVTRSVSLRADSLQRDVHEVAPHATCQCRSLAEIETVGDLVTLVPRSRRVFARPA